MSLHPCLQYGGIREERAARSSAFERVLDVLATGRGCDGRVHGGRVVGARKVWLALALVCSNGVVSTGVKGNELYRYRRATASNRNSKRAFRFHKRLALA
jgi:hypothetical protein